ncbi:MAG: M14-type cytosolic carboxypeptidase [Rikenellaceae bacterium]|nr:M14-type cytosolic carboxypeptidase [Rikenellaceae bacterium]
MFNKSFFLLLLSLISGSSLFSQIRISADFDSGSIGSYRLIDSVWFFRNSNDSLLTLSYEIESRFDPLNPVDTALRPSARWYHFRMEGVKGKQIFLNIKNSEAIRPVYSYDGVNFQRFETVENIYKGTVNKIFERDTVYISHFIPYPYSRHEAKLKEWKSLAGVKHEVIGHSTLGLPIEMLTVTDNSVSDVGKKRVWIHGRSHPSETPASWHLEAMIEEILSDSPFAKELRRNTIFYLVPFINPDGVKGGYSRSSSTGVNIEINWDRPDSLTMPEVKTLKAALERVTKDKPLDLLLNMHSQISSSVTYWIHTAESTTSEFLKEQQLLSALTINYTPFYRPQDQSFSAIAPRYVEGWIWDRFGEKTLAITFETPYTYYNQDKDGPWVSVDNLAQLGYSTLLAVSDLLDLDKENRIIADADDNRVSKRNWEVSYDPSSIFFGDTFLVSKKEGSSLKYKLNLKKGVYTLYCWKVGPTAESYPAETNRWVKRAKVIQRRDGNFTYRIKSTNPGEKADAILLVKEFE